MLRASSTPSRTTVASLIVGSAIAMSGAHAADIAPGQTLDPIPSAATSGTLETSGTIPFSISWFRTFPTPFTHTAIGNVGYSVYRHSDNTLSFRYDVNWTGGNTVINHFTARDFAGFETDTAIVSNIFNVGDSPDSVSRSYDGNSLQYFWDLGLSEGGRIFFVKTDATSYDLRGTATLYMFPNEGGASYRGLPRPVTDNTPPVVSITSPPSLGATCNPATIVGTASDTGGFASYSLDYSASANGPWTTIIESSTPVSNATLATWNTPPAQGWYYLRLTAENTSGLTGVVTTVVFVDTQFDDVTLRSPISNQVLGGTVCFDGTVNDGIGSTFAQYVVQYAPLPAGAPFNPVDPGSPVYTTAIINDGLASWNTRSGAAAVADGSYAVRVIGTDDCGHTRTVSRSVVIDNTAPVAIIAEPTPCRFLQDTVPIVGSADDANLSAWTLQYTGGNASTWVTIASGNRPVNNGVLANWNTAGLRPCSYTLRLLVSDGSAINCGSTVNQSEYTVSVRVGCPADFNISGGVSIQDLFDFLAQYFSNCI